MPLHVMDLGNNFMDMGPKAQAEKAKTVELYQPKMLQHSKETIHREKMQLAEWATIFANLISDEGLISQMYKEFI